jgi:hypothetical protein
MATSMENASRPTHNDDSAGVIVGFSPTQEDNNEDLFLEVFPSEDGVSYVYETLDREEVKTLHEFVCFEPSQDRYSTATDEDLRYFFSVLDSKDVDWQTEGDPWVDRRQMVRRMLQLGKSEEEDSSGSFPVEKFPAGTCSSGSLKVVTKY